MAGWVLAVSFNSSSGPSKQSRESGKPAARSASSKTARAAGNASARALPMPAACDPCPGKTNASFPIVLGRPVPRLLSHESQLLLDLFVETGVGEAGGHADG